MAVSDIYISAVCFFYALANRFFIQALFACLLIVVNYMSIASSANLFKNIENDGQQRLVILYQNHTRNGEALLQQARAERADVIAVNRSRLPGFDLSNYPGYYLFNEDNDWKTVLWSAATCRLNRANFACPRVLRLLT